VAGVAVVVLIVCIAAVSIIGIYRYGKQNRAILSDSLLQYC
jgi:hypothetical protein